MQPGDIHESDQYVIDHSGYTPLMVAARNNRSELLYCMESCELITHVFSLQSGHDHLLGET